MILKKFLSIVFITFFSYLILHHFQLLVYSGNFFSEELNAYAYSVYMPHGLRILFFLIYGFWSIPGLLIAHFVASLGTDFINSFHQLLSITIAAICVPLSALVLEKTFKEIENKFNLKYLIFLTLLSAFINGFFTNFYRYLTIFEKDLVRFCDEFFGYFVGDILGVILIVSSYLVIKRIFLLSIK
ncbi:hypothetical protein [Candidatus Pelagibacter sp. HIMB1709]|uniref:hypothetical protein n=1 Tax=Candidatus Pelagibacter sp. HIMB1709 TaxID=3413367 RepID=UPI003F8315B3